MQSTTEVKVSELSGIALDWAVGTAEGLTLIIEPPMYGTGYRVFAVQGFYNVRYWPSKSWAQGGPLIDKYRVAFEDDSRSFCAIVAGGFGYGIDHLKAACRAIVECKLGDLVSVPVELIQSIEPLDGLEAAIPCNHLNT